MVKNSPTNAGDTGSTPGSGRSPGGANGNPLQYSCLGNPMGRGAWWATVHGVTRAGYDSETKLPPLPYNSLLLSLSFMTLMNVSPYFIVWRLLSSALCMQAIKSRKVLNFWDSTYYFADKGPSSQSYGFSSSHVWMWELDHKESRAPKNCCFWLCWRRLRVPWTARRSNQSILKEI